MSCELLAVEIVQISLKLIEIVCKLWQNLEKKKREKIRKNPKLIFQTFSHLIFSNKHGLLLFHIKSEE
jgi:hypothetical protein